MADITMCSGKDCPNKDKCYRHTATPGFRQSQFTLPPIKADGTCDHYWGKPTDKIGDIMNHLFLAVDKETNRVYCISDNPTKEGAVKEFTDALGTMKYIIKEFYTLPRN